jgi:hypothetical protein
MRATDDQRCIAIFERWRLGLTEGGDSEARRGRASSSPAGETTAIMAMVRFFARQPSHCADDDDDQVCSHRYLSGVVPMGVVNGE